MDPVARVRSVRRAFPRASAGAGKRATVVALVLLLSLVSLAQAPDGLQPQGLVPWASFQHSDIDSVNMQSGALTFHIPLYSLPQRGRLALTFSLSGSPMAFGSAYDPQCPDPPTHCTLYDVRGSNYTGFYFRFDQPLAANLTQYRYPANSNTFYNIFYIIDSTGASHLLGYDNGNPALLRATDGSGLLYAPASTTPYSPFVPAGGWGGTVYQPDGIGQTLNPNSGSNTIQDPDGNSIVQQGSQITDSLGRVVPAAPPTPTSSTTGCPTISASYQPTSGSSTWTVPGPNGGQQTYLFCYTSITIRTNFWAGYPGGCHSCMEWTGTATMLQSVVLPNGTHWLFTYDAANPNDNTSIGYGQVTQAGLPTGGTISYQYVNYYVSYLKPPTLGRALSQRTFDPGNGGSTATWHYSFPFGSGSLTTSATDPLGNETVYTFSSVGGGSEVHETNRQLYQGSHTSGSLLRTIATSYQSASGNPQSGVFSSGQPGTSLAVFPTSVTTTLDNGQAATTSSQYNDGGFTDVQPACTAGANNTFSCTFSATTQVAYGRVTSASTTDYGGTTALKTVQTQYQYQQNSSYFNANFMDLISSATTLDSSGHQAAKISYGYDENNGSPQGIFGHRTSMNQWLNTTGGTVTVQKVYNSQGKVTKSIDALSNTTTTTYDSTGIFPSQIQGPDTTGAHHIDNLVYDANTGELTSHTDQNGQITSYGYDNMRRLTSVTYPTGGGSGTYAYNDNTPNPQFTFTRSITPGLSLVKVGKVDGLGRMIQSQVTSDPSGTDYTDTTYDPLGQVATVSNPYRSTNDPTYGVTTTQYGALGRITQVTKQDNTAVTVQYNQTSTNSPNGDCTLTTDEAGNPRKSCLDSLGRLIEVDEPQPSTGNMTNPYVTLYTYDALGNLLSVNQKGDGSQAARQRTFTYDSLSRLLTATNPESGQISYSYDANGNVLQKTSPAPNQTGSATQTISYCYDALDRVTGKAYSAQSCPLSSPVVTYSYDSGTNGIGHLTSLTDQAGSGSYSYDALGRVASEQRTIAGNSKTLSYTYNLDSSVATLTYPSGAVVTYTPDAAGRVLSAVDNSNNINYVTSATYGPDNSLTGFLSGQSNSFAGITNSFSYNPRLQPVNMQAVAPDCTGSGCSASVTISGSLGTAASTTGTPPPNAAPGSALSGYEDSSGVNHWLYEGTNDHLYEVYWNNNGSGRGYADATVETGGPSAAPTTALSTYLDNSQVPHWIYEDGAQHMQLFWIFSGMWGSLDNTVFVGSPVMATGTALTSKEDTNCMQHWAFFGSNKDLYEMHHDAVNGCLGAGVSGYSDGTATTGAPAAAPGSAMSMYFDNSQVAHWIYEDSNQHIQLLWWLGSGSWGNIDVTTTTGGPVAAPGSALTSREDTNCLQHWAYFGTNQHLYDAYHDDSSGCTGTPVSGYSDGTGATGAPPAAASGSALSMYFDNSQVAHWIYEDSSQHIQLLWYAGGSWGHLDVTTTAGSPLAAPGSALASGEDTNCLQRWLYFGSNQHLYEVHAQGNAGGGCSGSGVWGYSDVTAATPSETIDSGTVSLTVGNFTATACFGSSTNPACTGQPVNDNAAQVAAALAQALNGTSSPVAASASGATINMTWKASGAATPVSPLSTTHDNPNLFTGPSFTSPAASFGGGTGGTLPVFSLTYNFNLGNGDNGNVIGITNNRDTTRSQSFTYDYLNRLTSAQNAGTNCNQMTVNGRTAYWGNSYGYDPWGNLLQKNPTKCSPEGLSVSVLPNNQLVGYGYDAAGNMTHDATTNLNYTFDAENRITGAAGYTYTYDADGNRVEKSKGGTGTIYWHMSPGIVAESDLGGSLKSEYVFFDGERVARKDFPGNAVSYYFSDHLKTASVITDSAGNIKEDEDYYPWGGELQFVNSDSNHYKFTGKERDSETQLDYFGARYYGNWVGRWPSADEPLADQDADDPQSWNLYSYVRNSPATLVDRDGRSVTVCINLEGGGKQCETVSNGGYERARAHEENDNIRAPKLGESGDITCGGQVCGHVEYQRSPCVSCKDAILPLTLGPGDLILFGPGRSLFGGMARGGEQAAALSARMAAVRAAGEAGEVAAGIVKNTRQIVSETGTAAFRVPDVLDDAAKVIGEVKNVPGKLSLTNQIKDFVAWAQKNGYTFVLHVPQSTTFTKPLQNLINSGVVTVVRF